MPNKSQGNPENRKPLSVSTNTQANGNNTKALNMKFFLSLKQIIPTKDLYKESRTINSEVISTDTINETSP